MFRTNKDIEEHNKPVIFVQSLPYNQIRYFIIEEDKFSNYINSLLFISVIRATPVNI